LEDGESCDDGESHGVGKDELGADIGDQEQSYDEHAQPAEHEFRGPSMKHPSTSSPLIQEVKDQ